MPQCARMIYSARFIQQTRIFSALGGVWDLRREGHIVPSARQSITWSPPSSRRRSYPVGKLPDEFLANAPDSPESVKGNRKTHPRRRGKVKHGNEERTHRKNQGWMFRKQWWEGRRIKLSGSKAFMWHNRIYPRHLSTIKSKLRIMPVVTSRH